MKRYYFTILLILSGIFSALLQAWLNIPLLAFIAFAPMMYALCTADGKTQYLLRFAYFFIPYYIVQLSFLVTVYHIVPLPKFFAVIVMGIVVLLLSLWESLLMFVPLFMLMWLKRGKITDIFVVSLLICGGEWLQENIIILHFPWSAVWLTVTDMPIFMQTANLLGCRVVTFIILVTNGLLAFIVMSDKKLVSISLLAIVQSITVFYGIYSLSHLDKISSASQKINVICAQDEIEGERKKDISSLTSAKSYISILNDNWVVGTSLVLLPETAVSTDYDESLDEFKMLKDFAVEKGCTVVTGCFFNDGKDYNAMYAISPAGKISSPYCKQVLVPFGERMPFSFLFGESTLSECRDNEKIQPLRTSEMSIGASICIESIYPDIVRRLAKSGSDLLCISTNDSWFGKSFARQQHYRHSIMRAVENGKYLLRAGNCGISAVISPNGKVMAQRTDSAKGICSCEISLINEKNLYSKWGNIFITLPILLITLAIIRRFTTQA